MQKWGHHGPCPNQKTIYFSETKHHMFWLSYECFSILCNAFLLKSAISSHSSCEEVLLNNSFVYSSFNYYPLVWDFCSSKNCIEKIQEWALRLLHNDFASDYAELLKK